MIYLPPPQPVLNKDIRMSGDVEIHPTASLAPGVILQASSNNRIVIGADVCIGMGVIINASHGSVDIESGAILGSGVLIIGACKIGNNACIGTAVTIFQTSIEAMTVVEPGSVLGDSSRQLDLGKQEDREESTKKQQPTPSAPQSPKKSGRSKVGSDGYYSPNQAKKNAAENISQETNSFSTPTKEMKVSPERKSEKSPVVGQVYINQLLVTLFPHNKDFNSQTKKLG
ncbi:MAG: hypothetical protein ACFCAD_19445 [Pleurocapsa sp.]